VEIELDTVADEWQLALDTAADALTAAARTLPLDELQERRRRLALERTSTERELARLAHDVGIHRRPWLAPFPVRPSLLGLGDTVRACIFDLDGVLTDSGVLHAAAWAEVFDDVLLRVTEPTGWQFVPFDRVADYTAYLDGRPRLEGIHLFLRSRGIRLSAEEANALARRKSDALGRRLRQRGVNAVAGARLYLEAAGRAGLERAVVSSSTRTLPMLELAGLASLVEARVDAEQIVAGDLRSRPAPDLLLRACELLAVAPDTAVSFTHSSDGVLAAQAAGMRVVRIPGDVERLADLLDRRVVAAAA
jgi:beta-phosphoglucomutase-like phosphatase (HAD superfamily)